jgi:hypothetical protein
MRVKNIQAGYVDSQGFHPIRSSVDYDPDRAGDYYSQKPKKKAKRKTAAKGRTKNPLPLGKFIKATIKRVKGGFQVLIPLKKARKKSKPVKRRTVKRRTSRVARRRR